MSDLQGPALEHFSPKPRIYSDWEIRTLTEAERGGFPTIKDKRIYLYKRMDCETRRALDDMTFSFQALFPIPGVDEIMDLYRSARVLSRYLFRNL